MTSITVRYRKYSSMDWTEDTFAPDKDEFETETVRRGLRALYQRNNPRPGGWGIGLWNRIDGGHTAHVQMTAHTGHRRTHISLDPTIIVQWRVTDDADE